MKNPKILYIHQLKWDSPIKTSIKIGRTSETYRISYFFISEEYPRNELFCRVMLCKPDQTHFDSNTDARKILSLCKKRGIKADFGPTTKGLVMAFPRHSTTVIDLMREMFKFTKKIWRILGVKDPCYLELSRFKVEINLFVLNQSKKIQNDLKGFLEKDQDVPNWQKMKSRKTE